MHALEVLQRAGGIVLHGAALGKNLVIFALRRARNVQQTVFHSSNLSLQAAILTINLCVLYGGIQARRRAQFAAAIRVAADLDDESLRLVLKFIPAWVKHSEYERAKFLNDALQVLWPAFDRALGNFLKVELEPMLRASTPAAVDGCSFEALSFGATPIQIMGVKTVEVATRSSGSDSMSLVYDIDVRWAGSPDISLMLTPSRKWIIKQRKIGKLKVVPELNFTPAMVVALNTLHMSAVIRVTLSPVLHDVPFIGSVSFCFLDMPYLDFDLRGLGGADLMSLPAISEWLHASMTEACFGELIWPKRQTVSFLPVDEDDWQAPVGVVTVEVMEARLPQRLTLTKKEKPLNPYAAVVVGHSSTPVSEETGPNVQTAGTATMWGMTQPVWREKFHLCVFDTSQVLKLVIAHNMDGGTPAYDVPLGRVDVPLGGLMAQVQRKRGARIANSALSVSRAHRAMERARLGLRQRNRKPRTSGSRSTASAEQSATDSGMVSDYGALARTSKDSLIDQPSGSANSKGLQRSGGSEFQSAASLSERAGRDAHDTQHDSATMGKSLNGGSREGLSTIRTDNGGGTSLHDDASPKASGTPTRSEAQGSVLSDRFSPTRNLQHGDVAWDSSGGLRSVLNMAPGDLSRFGNAAGAVSRAALSSVEPSLASDTQEERVKQSGPAVPPPKASSSGRASPVLKRSRSSLRTKASQMKVSPPSAHTTAHEAALAASGADGAWLPLISVSTDSLFDTWDGPAVGGTADTAERGRLSEFFPSVSIMSALMGKSANSDVLPGGSSPGFLGISLARKGIVGAQLHRGMAGSAESTAGSASKEGSRGGEPVPDAEGRSFTSFWDWHTATSPGKRARAAMTRSESSKSLSSRLLSWLAPATSSPPAGGSPPASLLRGATNGSSHASGQSAPSHGAGKGSTSEQGFDAAEVSPLAQAPTLGGTGPAATRMVDVLGLVRLRIAYHPLASNSGPLLAERRPLHESANADATADTHLEAGSKTASAPSPSKEGVSKEAPVPKAPPQQRVGVLMIQLCSATLRHTTPINPAIKISIGKQTRQTSAFETAHGGRVSWDEQTLSFAMLVDADPEDVIEEVVVELGDVVTTLGDRVWATWFTASPASQSSQNVTPLGTARIPLAGILQQGKQQGTWQLRRQTEEEGEDELSGQITMRFAWRSALAT